MAVNLAAWRHQALPGLMRLEHRSARASRWPRGGWFVFLEKRLQEMSDSVEDANEQIKTRCKDIVWMEVDRIIAGECPTIDLDICAALQDVSQ